MYNAAAPTGRVVARFPEAAVQELLPLFSAPAVVAEKVLPLCNAASPVKAGAPSSAAAVAAGRVVVPFPEAAAQEVLLP